ncbi:MAG: hypothetical protein ACREX8_19670 [Gammaproteobacteria bacterium]
MNWWAVVALVLLGLLLIAVLIRMDCREHRARRKARAVHEVAAAYRKYRAQDADRATGLTVSELVQRIEAEGLPTRLQWEGDEESGGPNDDD